MRNICRHPAPHIDNLQNLPTPLTVAGRPMRYVKHAKFLGLIIDPSLTWSGHLPGISQHVHRTLQLLRYYKSSLRFSLCKRFVESLIFPVFNYAAVVYYTVTVTEETRLQRLLNACVHFVKKTIDHSSKNDYTLK